VIDKTLEYHAAQGVQSQAPVTLYRALRPIIEFFPGLKLFDFGEKSLAQVDIFDTVVNDALSNINGRRTNDVAALTLMGRQIQTGDLIVFNNDTSPAVRRRVYRVQSVRVDAGAPVINLQEVVSANTQSCVTVKAGSNRGTNWLWNTHTEQWDLSSQTKQFAQQPPLFDLYDFDQNSFSSNQRYAESTFNGTTLFEYQQNQLAQPDSVLGFGLTYRNIANVGDIVFANTFETQNFEYQLDTAVGSVNTVPLNQGLVKLINPVTGQTEYYSPWQLVRTNLELYQTINFVGQRVITLTARLLNKTTSKNIKVFVNQGDINQVVTSLKETLYFADLTQKNDSGKFEISGKVIRRP
jgi:hypothetical protein